MVLIIDHKKTHVNYVNSMITIKKENHRTQRISPNVLTQMIVYGRPSIDVAVFWALSYHGIPTILLPSRTSHPPAIVASGLAARLPLRQLQYRCATQPFVAFLLAKDCIEQKIHSYQLPLYALSHQVDERAIGFIERCDLAHEALELIEDASINSLMGIEGQLARNWFAFLSETLDSQWHFTGRNRRPPRDPVNALLSLGYTLLSGDVRQALISEGLDPAFGFLHQPRAKREALLLDMLEVFRSGVDLFVLQLLPRLRPSDFSFHQEQGCRLRKAKRGLFFGAWAHYRQQWPRPIVAASIKQALSDTKEWPSAPIQEQVRGKVTQLRQFMERHDAKKRA